MIYTHDMSLLYQQSKVLQKIFAEVVDLLKRLGFLVKREKYSPIPCQHLIFLLAVLDSRTITLSLPQPNLTSIGDICHHLLAQRSGSVRTLSTLIGQMSHSYIANTDLGYTTSLERERSLPGDLHREPLDCGRDEVAH